MGAKPKPGGKLWSGRFAEPVSELVKRYTASVGFDRRLAPHDIRGSLAHARMLRSAGILSRGDLRAIERGLSRIAKEIAAGHFRWSLEAEDVHLNIERRLIELAGNPGKRLHTARSRNDQVATDLRLWLREAIDEIARRVREVQKALLAQAEKHAATICSRISRCSSAIARASRIVARASTACRSEPPRSPAPRSRSTGRASRANSASRA